MDVWLEARAPQDVYYLPAADWLPVLSLGHREALADLVWMRALVYFGEGFRDHTAGLHVFDYAEAILRLDPDFRSAYRWIGTAGIYRAAPTTAEDARRTAAFLRRGAERFPDDGELAWLTGATLAFELPPLLDDPAARDEARSEGADYLATATRLGGQPPWLTLASASLLARVGRMDAAIRHLEEMYAVIDDEAVRLEIATHIEEIRGQIHAAAFVDASGEEERRRARELPYLAPDLYFLVGPRPPVDWVRALRDGPARALLDGPSLGTGPGDR